MNSKNCQVGNLPGMDNSKFQSIGGSAEGTNPKIYCVVRVVVGINTVG
jgi:hypothetical protein